MTVELQESAKTLSEVVDYAVAGEEVLLIRGGKPIARVTAIPASQRATEEQAQRRLGFLKGRYKVPDDIKTPFKKDIEAMFYGDPDKFSR
jgi:antitoxin (DNA-binding transcriptional repressor) of toxin-antitoxin stability system